MRGAPYVTTMIIGKGLFLFAFVALVAGDVVVVNEAIDKLLEEGRKILRAKGQDKIKIPNLDKTFEKKIFGSVSIKGEFHASGGLFQDVASLHRTGDITMNTNGNRLTIQASMGLGLLEVLFGHYDFKLMSLTSTGNIDAKCKTNAVTARIALVTAANQCHVEVEKASLDSIGDFDIHMSGPGVINQLGTQLFTWVLNHFNDNIRAVVNQRLKNTLEESIKNVDLCKMIPH